MRVRTVVSVTLLALSLTLPLSVILLLAAPKDADCGEAGRATIDPAAVPDGPIAGYGHEQLANAAWIMRAGADLGLNSRDQAIGVMTAMGESGLTVADRGDNAGPDSRGLFQQRDNGAWGTYADRLDPYTSATNFFRVLMTVAGRDSMTPTQAAHEVQRNADTGHYAQFWAAAQQVVTALQDAVAGHARDCPQDGEGCPPTPAAVGSETSLTPDSVRAMRFAAAHWPQLRTIGGWRPPDGYNEHSAGKAIDLMIPDWSRAGRALGDEIAQYFTDHAQDAGVAWIIWRQRIWTPGAGWQAMADRGSPTQNHMDHVHLATVGAAGSDAALCGDHPGFAVGGGDCPLDQVAAGFRAPPADCDTALKRAAAEAAHPSQGWSWWCLKFVATSYGYTYAGVPAAIDEYRLLKQRGLISTTTDDIPRGAILFSQGDAFGHIWIYAGQGMAYSTDMGPGGAPALVPWDAPLTRWGQTWLGWAPPVFPRAG